MNILMRQVTLITMTLALSSAPLVVGCSSSASEEETRQLNDLKAEVSSLEQQITAKEKEKANHEKQVAEKNAKLQQCMADRDAVKGTMK